MKRGYLALYSFPKTVNMTWKGSEVKNWYDTSRAGNCDLCDSQRYFGLHKDVGVCLSNRRTREAEQFSEITLDPISWQWKTFSPFFLNLRFLHFAQNKEKSLRGHKGNMNFPCQIFIDFRNAKQEKKTFQIETKSEGKSFIYTKRCTLIFPLKLDDGVLFS